MDRGPAEQRGRARTGPLMPGNRTTRLVPPADLLWLRVLIVEENQAVRTSLHDTLKTFAFEPHTASSGTQALELMRSAAKPFDLMLLNNRMPDKDVLPVIHLIQQDPGFRDIPIILIGGDDREGEKRALASGARVFLIEPIQPAELFETILEVFGRGEQEERSNLPACDTHTTDRRQKGQILKHIPRPDDQRIPTPAVDQGKTARTGTLPEAPGLDIKAALGRLGGNDNLYRKLLTRFVQQYAACPQDFREALARGDTAGIGHLAHALRGVAGNLSAVDVQENARVLESLAADGSGADLGTAIDRFEQAWLTLRASAASLAVTDDAQRDIGRKPPAVHDRPALTSLVLKLRDCLRRNDMAAEDCLEELLRLPDTLLRHPEMNTLAEQVGAFDFEQALVTLQALLDRWDISTEAREG